MAKREIFGNRNFQIAAGAMLLGFMMVSMITPAFPKMVQTLGISEQSIGLLITACTLPCLLLSPFAGIVTDKIGRKKMLVPSIFFFGIAGGSCAFANDFNTLLILRLLQGIGAAPLFGTSVTIIGDIFTGQQRSEAMGLNTTVNYTGYVIYPLVGGALANLTWSYPFLPFLLAIPVGIIALFYLQYPEPKNRQTLKDYLGDTLHYLRSLHVLWLFLAAAITYILHYGAYLIYFGILLDSQFHAPPFTIGVFFSIIGLTTAATSYQVGTLSKRFSPSLLMVVAFTMYTFAMLIIPVLPNLWLLLLPTIIFGIGHGLNSPSMHIIAASLTQPEHRAGFMALLGTMILLGMTVAPLVTGLIFRLSSLNSTFIVAGFIALLIPVMAVIIMKKKLFLTYEL